MLTVYKIGLNSRDEIRSLKVVRFRSVSQIREVLLFELGCPNKQIQ